jgi:hypothetical protein
MIRPNMPIWYYLNADGIVISQIDAPNFDRISLNRHRLLCKAAIRKLMSTPLKVAVYK